MLKLITHARPLLLRLAVCLALFSLFASGASAAAGDLDPAFNGTGFVSTDIVTKDEALALAIQRDGKIIAAGFSTGIGTAKDFTLVRYNTNGTRDISFGVGGKVITHAVAGNQNDSLSAIALQADGNIVVAGAADVSGGNSDFVVARYISATGSLDPSFGAGGLVISALSSKNDIPSALIIQPDQHILVGGSSDGNFALARYNPNGTPDTTLNGSGFVTTDFGKNDLAHAMLLQPDDKIVLGGETDANPTGTDFALARYTKTGALDPTFGSGGKVTTNFSLHSNEFINALALQTGGEIVAAGRTNSNISDFALARYTSAGLLDATFGGGDGFISTNVGPGDDEATSILLQHTTQDILVAGFSFQGAARLNDFTLARYTNGGGLDLTFGHGGLITTTLQPTTDDLPFAMAAQADHNVVLAGMIDDGANTNFAVARYLMPDNPPELSAGLAAGLEDTPLAFTSASFTSHYSDLDGDALSKVKITALPAHGALQLAGLPAALDQEVPAAELAGLAFVPDPNWNGTTTLRWTASDGLAYAPLDAALDLQFQPVNDPPSFTKGPDVRLRLPQEQQVFSGWASNLSAGPADESGQTLAFLVSDDNAALFSVRPSIAPDGSLSFTPAPGQFGAAIVHVRLQDNGGVDHGGVDTSAEQVFTITLQPFAVFLPEVQTP